MTILRYWLLGLAVLIAAVIGWRSLGLRPSAVPGAPAPEATVEQGVPSVEPARTPPAEVPPPTAPAVDPKLTEARADIGRRLDEVPQFAAFYKGLAAAFPRLYADLVDGAAQAVATGGMPPTAGALLWNALGRLQQSNGILASNADEAALSTFFDARLALLDVLATADPRTCADFLYGTTDPAIESFSVAHRDLVAEMAMQQLAVIEDGRRKHLDPGAPSSEDLDLVAGGLAARKLSPDEIAMLLDGKPVDPPLPDARTCDLGRTYLSVLKSLPAPVKQRVYGFAAELLARS